MCRGAAKSAVGLPPELPGVGARLVDDVELVLARQVRKLPQNFPNQGVEEALDLVGLDLPHTWIVV